MGKKIRRQDSQRYKKVKDTWRRPRGVQSNQRKEEKGSPAKPKIGKKKPEEIRGLHPSGYEEKLVHNTSDLENIKKDKEAIRISSKVGRRKRQKIEKEAEEKGIKILNKKHWGEKSDRS